MLYGICGPHRAGKTTLAKTLAEELSMTFHATSTTEVSKRLGFDPVAPMSLMRRVELQYGLLQNHLEELKTLPRPLIVDRTPLDMLGYLLAEFHMTSDRLASNDTLQAASNFVDLALEATKRNYDYLYYVGPLPAYTVDPTKATPNQNKPFQLHHALLVQGALSELHGDLGYVIIDETDFEFRRDFIHDHIVARLDEIDKQAKSAPYH